MNERLSFLRRYLTPRIGRLSPSQLRFLGTHLQPPAFFSLGPFIVLVDLPESLHKADHVPSVEEVNAALRQLQEQLRRGLAGVNPPAQD